MTPAFWIAVGQIIMIDILLGGANAVVIAIAGAAQAWGNEGHQMPRVVFGLLVSIPIIAWGSQLVIKLMDRFPVIIVVGMLLGWIAGTIAVSDPALASLDTWTLVPKLPQTDAVHYAAGLAGALLVLALGQVGRAAAGGGRPMILRPVVPHGAPAGASP